MEIEPKEIGPSKNASDARIAKEPTTPTDEDELLNVNSGDGRTFLNSSGVVNEVKKTPVLAPKPLKPPKKRKRAVSVDIIKKEGSRVVSEIWGHFSRIEDSNPPRASCNYCGTSYVAHPKDNGTTSMWSHLENSCKKYPYRKDKSQKTMHDFRLSENLKGKALNYEELRKLLAEMIIIDGLPFRFVEGDGFKAFVKGFDPRFQVPSRHTVARDCLKIFVEEKRKLKLILNSQRVCLTTDTWTSVQNLNYMCLTAHWISSDWKLEKRIINFCIVENHRGETIAKQLEECLLEWGIDKIFTITVDNASSNDKAVNHLKTKCKWKDVILNNDYLHVRCSAHIVNLIVKEGLEEQNDVILRVRNAVKYVRSSPARLKAFKKCVGKEKITSKSLVCLDVETRWNSTYLMLESAEKFEKAFERLGDDDQKFIDYFDCYEINKDGESEGQLTKAKRNKIIGPPKDVDWISARNFVKFLKIFFNVTLKFSGSSYITSNIFFRELATIYIGLSTMHKNGDSTMSSMAYRMKVKFNKYWGNLDSINMLLFVAIVLDPRCKLKYVNFCLTTMYENAVLVKRAIEKVEEILNLLYKQYADCDIPQVDKVGQVRQESNTMEINEDEDLSKILESQFAKHLEEEQCVESKSEIARYLLDGCEKSDNEFDILTWWKVNTTKYPVLSKLARDVLSIPVSTISSESAFSTSGRVIDPFRSSLSPKTVEALICAQDWLRAAPFPINLHSVMEDIEEFEHMEKDLRISQD